MKKFLFMLAFAATLFSCHKGETEVPGVTDEEYEVGFNLNNVEVITGGFSSTPILPGPNPTDMGNKDRPMIAKVIFVKTNAPQQGKIISSSHNIQYENPVTAGNTESQDFSVCVPKGEYDVYVISYNSVITSNIDEPTVANPDLTFDTTLGTVVNNRIVDDANNLEYWAATVHINVTANVNQTIVLERDFAVIEWRFQAAKAGTTYTFNSDLVKKRNYADLTIATVPLDVPQYSKTRSPATDEANNYIQQIFTFPGKLAAGQFNHSVTLNGITKEATVAQYEAKKKYILEVNTVNFGIQYHEVAFTDGEVIWNN